MGKRHLGNVVHAFFGQIGCDLQENRQALAGPDRLFRASGENSRQKFIKAFLGLQVAEAGRVGRGNVGGKITGDA